MTGFDQKLPPLLENFLLATRCFGRATPFPHCLMKEVLALLDSEAIYSEVIQDLLSKKLIVKAGKVAFEVSRAGFNHISFKQVQPVISKSALGAMFKTVPAAIERKDMESLDLLYIHAAGLANAFRSQSTETYVYIMGLSVQCMIELGLYDEAAVRLRSMQRILDKSSSPDEA